MSYRLVDVNPNDEADALRLADLFNDLDSAWPGGFTRGLPETAESLRRRLGEARRLAICAVEHQGDFVGFCDLMPCPGEADRAYVHLLTVRLAHHGRGVGKMLLLEMVRRAASLGCRVLSLHTWPGNSKAIPLYKRTGFQWEPDTSVHMENFIPAILALPVARRFFERADWYACLQRDASLKPDDATWHGMAVYEYRFRNGDDYLNVWVDRIGGGITAVETPDFLAGCSIPAEWVVAGRGCPIEWTIALRREEPLPVQLAACASEGLELDVYERRTVEREATFRHHLRARAAAREDRPGDPPRRVRSRFLLDDQVLELETGVRLRAPFDILVAGTGLRLGRQGELRVRLQSYLDEDLVGTMTVVRQAGLECATPQARFHLPGGHQAECRFPWLARASGQRDFLLRITAGDSDWRRRVPVRIFDGCLPVGSIDAEDERAVLENGELRVEAELRGGKVTLFSTQSDRPLARIAAPEVGPPFLSYRLRPALYRARLRQDGDRPTLVLWRQSDELPGLVIERHISLDAGAAVRLSHRLLNDRDEARPVALRVAVSGESLYRFAVTYPLPECLVREVYHGWGYFPSGQTDVLPVGGRLSESWCAAEEAERVVGLVWSGAPEEHWGWENIFPILTYELGEVPANDWAEVGPLWVIAGPGSWRSVREHWQMTVGGRSEPEGRPPVPRPVFEVLTDPEPAVLAPSEDQVRLVVCQRRGLVATGQLDLSFAEPAGQPSNETRSGRTDSGQGAPSTVRPPSQGLAVEPTTIELGPIDRARPQRAELRLRVPDGPFAALLEARAQFAGEVKRFRLPILRLSGHGRVDVGEENGLIWIDNGALRYQLAPAFGGSIISVEWQGEERLRSAYPSPRPFMWTAEWLGGIHPCIEWIGSDHLSREAFTGSAVVMQSLNGEPWRGGRVVCEPGHRDRRWLRLELAYLTQPQSNALLLLLDLTNRSGASVRAEQDVGLAIWLATPASGSLAHWERDGKHEVAGRGPFSRDMRSDSWVAVSDAHTGAATLLVPADQPARAYIEDLAGEGHHLGLLWPVTLQPGETRRLYAWLVFCQLSELEAYAGLGNHRPLPHVERPGAGHPTAG